jgi:hypothetical protein
MHSPSVAYPLAGAAHRGTHLLTIDDTGDVKGHFSLHLVQRGLKLHSVNGTGTVVSLEKKNIHYRSI